MSKASNRIVLILGLLAVSLFSGCGVTSTTLPSNLQPGGGGFLSIATTQFPDAITGRSYNLVISTSGGSGSLSSCSVVSGTLPSGLSLAVGSPSSTCLLTTNGSPVGAAGPYSVVVQATDTSSPPKSDQLPYNLTVRNDFSVCAGPTSAASPCTPTSPAAAATSFPDAVQGRSYGMSPLSQIVQTNLNGTADASPVGHPGEFGNGPFTSASTIAGLAPGINSTARPSQGNFAISSTAVGAASTYTVTVNVTDTPITVSAQTLPVVPARTATKTYTHIVHPPITVNLNFSPPPDAVTGRTYGAPAKTDLIYTIPAGQGLAPITMTGTGFPAPITCPTTNGTQQLNCNSGNAAVSGATSAGTVTAVDTANTATPVATPGSDPNSQRTTDTVNVRAVLALTPPGGSLAAAVVGRSWGQGSVCAPGATGACASAVYAVANGLGGYIAGPVTAGPLSCAFTSTGAFSGNYTCSTSNEVASPPSAAIALTVSDGANQTTPSASVSDSSETLTINPELNFTALPTSPFADAVVGRPYGQGSTCGSGSTPCNPLTYTIQPGSGLGGYSYQMILPVGNGGFTCTSGGTSTACSSGGVTEAANTYAPYVAVTDFANASTPGRQLSSLAGSLTIHSELALTPPASIAAAVTGRSFGVGSTCGAAGTATCATLNYAASNGLGNYVSPATMTTTAGTFTCPLSSTTYQCASTTITGTGTPTLSLTASEVGNASTPGNSKTDNSASLTINPEMNFTVTPTSPLAVAVHGRTYGQGSSCGAGSNVACAPLTYTIQNNTGLGGYSYAFVLNSGNGGFACTSGGTSTNCSSGNVTETASAIPYTSVHASVTDTGNASTPSNTVPSPPSSYASLTVDPELNFTALPTSPFPDAVNGRTYGQGSTCGSGSSPCNPLTYSIGAGSGLGGYSYQMILPVGNGGFTCTSAGTSSDCTSSSVTEAANAIPYAPYVAVTDTANASTPARQLSSSAGSLTVHSELSITAPGTVPTAVHGRAYGTGTGCSGGACTPLQYTVSNGLGNYTLTGSSLTTPSDTFACTLASPTFSCSKSAIAGAGGTNPTLTFTAADTGDASTPGNTVTNTSKTLNTNAEMTLTLPGTVSQAVVGRRYGTGAGCSGGSCTPLTYTVPAASPGLGGYTFTPNNFPAGFTCPTTTNSGNCQAASVGGSSGTLTTLTVTVTDTANPATPSNSVTSSPATSLQVNNEMVVSPPASAPVDAVLGRRYGTGTGCSGGSCTPVTFTVSPTTPGLGGYTFTPSGFPAGFTCPTTTNVGNCQATLVGGTAGTFNAVTVTATDTANTSTPSATSVAASPAQSLTVRSALAINIPNPSPIPDAVTGRVYGTPGGTQDLIYSLPPGQGLPTVTLAGLGFPTPIACATQTNTTDSSVSMHCTSGGVIVGGATATGTVTATDTANASTPAATTSSDTGSQLQSATATQITVDPEILIPNQSLITPICGTVGTPCALPNGQQNQPYSVLFTCQAPLGTGTCGGTGSPGNAAAQYTWTATSNTFTGGTDFTTTMPVLQPSGNATFAGITTAASSGATVTIGVADNGNITTPSCAVAATCPSEDFTAQILSSAAYVGASGTNAIGLFDTSVASTLTEVGTGVTLGGAGTTPNYVAASSNGTFMFIADPTNHQVFIYNTLTGATTTVTHTQGLHNAAGDTQAIAVMAKVVPTTGISPDDVNVIVANRGTDNVDVIDADPTSGTFGTVTGSGTFTLGGSHAGAGPVDLKMAPTFFVGGARETHGYVLREGGDEVCVFDIEPSSSPGTQIPAAHSPNAENCIPLGSTSGVIPKFIDVSPDGLYAFVTESDGTTTGALKIIDTNPNSATFETLISSIDLTTPPVTLGTGDGTLTTFSGNFAPVPVIPGSLEVIAGSVTGIDDGSGSITGTGITGTVTYSTGAISVTFDVAPTTGTLVQVSSVFSTTNPAGVRVSPDGQTVWVAGEDSGGLLGFETARVGSTQFRMVTAISTPTPASDNPLGIAFRPDGAVGLATLSASTPNSILPFTTTAGAPLPTTGVTTPSGIDHIPNAVLHIVTASLPAATHGVAYASSIVANGPNKYFTFTDLTAGPNNLAGLGLTLASDGQVTSITATSITATGTFSFAIQVTDQSKPVNNVVVKTIPLTIN